MVCTSYDISGCSLKEYTQNFYKGFQNFGKSKFNNNAAKQNQTSGVGKTTVDETGVDKTGVDETGVDKLGCYPARTDMNVNPNFSIQSAAIWRTLTYFSVQQVSLYTQANPPCINFKAQSVLL